MSDRTRRGIIAAIKVILYIVFVIITIILAVVISVMDSGILECINFLMK